MDWLVYPRSTDWFYVLDSMWNDPTEYFDFPSSALAFAEGMPTSNYAELDGARFRLYGMTLTYLGGNDKILSRLRGYKIKSLNFVNKGDKYYGEEFYTTPDWDFNVVVDSHNARTRKRLRAAIHKGNDLYDVRFDPPQDDVLSCFDKWYVEAKQRIFMVIKGHYLSYIRRYYLYKNNVKMFGLYRDNQMCGFYAYEVWRGFTQVTCCKLLIQPDFENFAKYAWVALLNNMANDTQLKCKMFCGSTADELKLLLGLDHTRSYKIDVSNK